MNSDILDETLNNVQVFVGDERKEKIENLCKAFIAAYGDDVTRLTNYITGISDANCKPPLTVLEVTRIIEEVRMFYAEPTEDDEHIDTESDYICFADYEPQEVDWLWFPYIPMGKITLIQGYHGEGKTFVECSIAAITSTGSAFPETNKTRTPGTVVLQNGEDDFQATLIPRLKKCGADRKNIIKLNEDKEPLRLSDVERIEQLFQDKKPSLFIIDPLQQYLGANVDMHRANETRPLLAHLQRLAEKYNVSIVIISHMGKSDNLAINKSLGSVDIPAIARSVLMIGKNRKKQEQKLMIQVKNNLTEIGEPLGFRIDDMGLHWEGAVEATEADILSERNSTSDSGALANAISFIKQMVSDTPIWSNELEEHAQKEGISKRTLERARRTLIDDWVIENQKIGNRWCIKKRGIEIQKETLTYVTESEANEDISA